MFKCLYLTSLLIMLWPMSGVSQSTSADPQVTLKRLVKRMESGIYERILNLGYIPSLESYQRRQENIAHNEFTLLFFRFYDFELTADSSAYVGKVFMSERYLEKHYNKLYTSIESHRADKDGKFMACKLYFDERSLDYRLNIYPDYLLNICKANCVPVKGMHFNRVSCTSTEQHWQSLKHVISLSDKHFDDFSKKDSRNALEVFLQPATSQVNINRNYLTDAECTADEVLFRPNRKKNRNTLRTINLSKAIKIFKVSSIDDPIQQGGKTLTLKFTKYPLSEDLIEGSEYTCTFIEYDSLNDSRLAIRSRYGEFVSRNPLYRSLIIANEPNDIFVPGLELTPNLQLSYLGDTTLLLANVNQRAVKSETKKQDSIGKQMQDSAYRSGRDSVSGVARQPPASGAGAISDRAVASDQLLITSAEKRTDFWVYWGRGLAASVKNGHTIPLAANQYLRDAIPRSVSVAGNEVWLKGRITFQDNLFFCTQASDAGQWRVLRAVNVPLDSASDKAKYIWLNVSYVPPTQKTNPK